MGLNAGDLNRRVDIEQPVREQDSSGEMVTSWEAVWLKVPARIEHLSVRDLLAAKAADSQVTARITIRHRAGLKASMRVVHNGVAYKPAGWLPDKESGLEYVTAPCSVMESEAGE